MRDPKRIKKFCDELAEIWETYAPDWRFGQFMNNVFGQMQSEGRDIFFPEDSEMIEYFRNYFKDDTNEETEK